MSQRRSNMQTALCIFFTSLFLGSIELGQGIKCYTCNSLQNSDCANPSSSHIVECSLNTTQFPPISTSSTISSTLEGSTSSEGTSPGGSSSEGTSPGSSSSEGSSSEGSISSTNTTNKPLQFDKSELLMSDEAVDAVFDAITYDNLTYFCFTQQLGVHNGSASNNVIIRGCTENIFTCFDDVTGIKGVTTCNIEFCQTDECNSSGMVKMGMISLLLPLITVLLCIR